MKRLIGVLAVALCLIAGGTPAVAQERGVPHYFPEGIEQITTPARQWEAYLRYWRSMKSCMSEPHSSAFYTRAHKVEKTYGSLKVIFVLDIFTEADGKFYYNNFCNQREVKKSEVDYATADFVKYIEDGGELGTEYHRDLEPNAVQRRAENTGVSEADLRKQLDQSIPEDKTITFRDLTQIPPQVTRAAFYPKEVHLGHNIALGVAWLNSGVTWIAPEARVLDWLVNRPLTGLHELTHLNTVLQSYPMSERVDVEFIASVPMGLFNDEFLDLSSHPYLRRMREWVWVYFGYNFEQVWDKVIIYDYAGNIHINEKLFDEAFSKQQEFKPELLLAFKKIFAEYYSDQPYWGAVNDKLYDNKGVFDIAMSLRYDPTILEGHTKTMQWLEAHRPEIMRMALAAWKESGKPLGEHEGDEMHRLTAQNIRTIELMTGRNREELTALAQKYRITAEDVRGKSVPELMHLYASIVERERGKKGEVQ